MIQRKTAAAVLRRFLNKAPTSDAGVQTSEKFMKDYHMIMREVDELRGLTGNTKKTLAKMQQDLDF